MIIVSDSEVQRLRVDCRNAEEVVSLAFIGTKVSE